MTLQLEGRRARRRKGRATGRKTGFTLQGLKTLESDFLRHRKWHDLCLLSLGVDSMYRAEDLLALRVWDLLYADGSVRSHLLPRQQKTDEPVYPYLTPETRRYAMEWIAFSGKAPADFLFTGERKGADALPITRGWYSTKIKGWAKHLDLPPEDYATHSIRRTKPILLFWEAEKRGPWDAAQALTIISTLLGHSDIATTLRYIGVNQHRADQLLEPFRLFQGHR